MKIFLFILLSFLWACPSYAITAEQDGHNSRTIQDYIKDFVDIPQGALDWKLFGQTEMTNVEGKDEHGMDVQYYSPGFSLDLQVYDGEEITIKGFMFPLDAAENQRLFLFGPFPLNCPYQYHVGPNLVIEVHADDIPVPFSYDPITLKGILELVPKDLEYGIFYRLKGAHMVK